MPEKEVIPPTNEVNNDKSSGSEGVKRFLKVPWARDFALLGVGLLLLIIYLLMTDTDALWDSIREIDIFYLILAIITSIMALALYSLAWQVILRGVNVHATFGRAFSMTMVSLFISAMIPSGSISGEATRTYLFARNDKSTTYGNVLASIVAHRLLMFFPFVGGALIGIIVLNLRYEFPLMLNLAMGIICTFVIAVFVAAILISNHPERPKRIAHGIVRGLNRLSRRKFEEKLNRIDASIDEGAEHFSKGINLLQQNKRILAIGGFIAGLAWLLYTLVAWFVFKGLGIDIDWTAIVLVYTIVTVLQILPVAIPGALGILEIIMAELYAIITENSIGAIAATLLIRAIMFWMVLFIGYFFLLKVLHLEKEESKDFTRTLT
ncbi:MAG: YbhN family protein [Candidatus Hodarchaeota archaeon]